MGIPAGDLNQRVTIQQLTPGQDAIGQPSLVWVDFATVWASVRFLSGAQALKADVNTSVARASIRIRLLAGVLPSMRVLHRGKVFDIKAVLPDPTSRVHLDLVVETGANQG